MNAIKEFFTTHKYAIIWTLCYTVIMWAILYFMFNFNMFNGSQWNHLIHAELHGFAGFVFGILILSMLPLYIATTTLVIRNKKPLITVPTPKLPKIKIPSFLCSTPAPAPVAEPETQTPTPEQPEPTTELSDEIPAEIRTAFIRARNNIGQLQTSAFNAPAPKQPEKILETVDTTNAFPIPTDFDIDNESDELIPSFEDKPLFSDTPLFSDISFDDTPEQRTEESSTATTTMGSEFPSDTNHLNDSAIIKHLTQSNCSFTITDDIILTDTHAISVHEDPDFWVADSENWFAAGKTRPSPIIAAKKAGQTHNKKPAIYIGSQNILDIDKLISEWESNGITVFTDLSEI